MSTLLIDHYRHVLDDNLSGNPWIDETFSKKFAQISEAEAFTRPVPEMHSVAELLSHLIAWRKVITDTLRGKAYVSVFDSPNNWKSNEELMQTGWEGLKQKFYESQRETLNILAHENDAWLGKVYADGTRIKYLLDGLLAHDLYHLGQIGITIKYLKNSNTQDTHVMTIMQAST